MLCRVTSVIPCEIVRRPSYNGIWETGMRVFARTIHRKLLLLLLAVGIAPAVAAALYFYWGSMYLLDNSLGPLLQDKAENAMSAIDGVLLDDYGAARRVRDAVSAGETTAGARPEDLARFSHVYLADWQGYPVETMGTTVPEARQVDLSEAPLPEADGELYIVESGAPGETILLHFAGKLRSPPNLVLICTVPAPWVLDGAPVAKLGGGTLDVFTARSGTLLNLRGAGRMPGYVRRSFAANRSRLTGWLRSPQGEDEQALAGFAASRWLRQRQNSGVTSLTWVAVSRVPVGDFAPVVERLLWRNLFYGIALAVALLLLSFWLARRFTRPLRLLRAHAGRVARGELQARVDIRTHDEIEDLASAVNEMAERLERAHHAEREQMRAVEAKASQLALIGEIGKSTVAASDLPQLFAAFQGQLDKTVAHDALAAVVFHGSEDADIHSFAGKVFADAADPRSVRLGFEEELLAVGFRATDLPVGPGEADTGMLNPEHARRCHLPLRVDRGLIGAIVLARRADLPFTEAEKNALSQAAQILALAVEHISLYDKTKDFARELERKVRQRTQELERTHARLVLSERHAATGRLAASIAHEVNNPLGIIKNYVRVLRDMPSERSADEREALAVIGEELDRIARIVRNLIDFYKPASLTSTQVDVNDEIRSLLSLMESGFAQKGIAVDLDLDPSLPRPVMSPDHLRQILLNLLKNAEDAIARTGTVRIATRSEQDLDGSRFIVLEIRDNGCGIQPDDKPHIFEPFFTTKRDQQGTGLGLSVTYGILRNLGGTIDVDSVHGHGTLVTARIPVEDDLFTRAGPAVAMDGHDG